MVDKSEVEFEHDMKVERIWEAPRVTKPYTEEQWREIEKLGHAIDARLAAGDVRLTMGGEPTFVSIDDPDGAEWNTAAMGPDKRRLAIDVYNRLKQKYAPQGLSHFGQGKWYPGEQLPRWSLNCFWRRDGEPMWQNPALLDDETGGARRYRGDRRRASWLRVAGKLGLDARACLRRLRRCLLLPVARAPLAHQRRSLQVEARRSTGAGAAGAKVFEQGLDAVIGHVLPVTRDEDGASWQTGPWFLRRERCYLIPGDSPVGYRLPLRIAALGEQGRLSIRV